MSIKEEMKSAFMNVGFAVAFGMMLLCLLGYSLPAWMVGTDWGDEYRQSALSLSIGGVFFGSSMLLLPFCANTAYSISQVDEIHSSMMHWKVMRSSVRRYVLQKMAASMISATTAVSMAFALHAILWNCIANPYNPVAHPYQAITFAQGCIYSQWTGICYALPVYIWMAATMGFCAAIWSVVGLAVAVWVPDKLLIVIIPVCFYELLSCKILDHLFGIAAPHPGLLYNDGICAPWVIRSFIMYSIIFAISLIVYFAGVKRRIQDA